MGRANMLILNSIGTLLGLIICINATTPTQYIAGRIIPALFKCGMGVPNAYIADVSHNDAELIIVNLGRLQAVVSFGMIVGPTIGGHLAQFDPRTPLYYASYAMILSVAFLLFVRENQPKASPSRRPSRILANRNSRLASLSPTTLLHIKFAFNLGNSIFEIYAATHIRSQLDLDESSLGYILSYYGLVSLFANVVLIPLIPPRISMRSPTMVGLVLLHSVALLVWGLSKHVYMIVAAVGVVSITSSLFLNTITTLLAEQTEASSSGATMGISAMVDRGAKIIAPLIGGFATESSSLVSVGVCACSFEVYCVAVLLHATAFSRMSSSITGDHKDKES